MVVSSVEFASKWSSIQCPRWRGSTRAALYSSSSSAWTVTSRGRDPASRTVQCIARSRDLPRTPRSRSCGFVYIVTRPVRPDKSALQAAFIEMASRSASRVRRWVPHAQITLVLSIDDHNLPLFGPETCQWTAVFSQVVVVRDSVFAARSNFNGPGSLHPPVAGSELCVIRRVLAREARADAALTLPAYAIP